MSYHFAYLFGNLFILFPIWLVLFYFRKDLRKEMLLLSIMGGVAGPISELLYFRDYWRPEILGNFWFGIEDVLFGFFIFGIAGVIYEELFGKHHMKRKTRNKHWGFILVGFVMLGLIATSALVFKFRVNSIYATIIVFMLMAAIMCFSRKDLFPQSIMSGILLGALMFVCYLIFLSFSPQAIQKWWMLKNISGVLIIGVPLEELLWAFAWGAVAGQIYEYFAGLRFKKS